MRMNVDALAAMPWHEYANLFPMMDEWSTEGGEKTSGALLNLAEDLKRNGCHTPVVLFQGTVLDGRNRITAARLAGLDFLPTTEYEGTDPLMYVLSLNLHRRHLTTDQLVELGARIAEPLAGRAGRPENERTSALVSGKTSALVADALGGAVSARTLESGWAVRERSPELWRDVQRGARSVTGAYREMQGPPAFTPTSDGEKLLDKADRAYDNFLDAVIEMRTIGNNEQKLRLVKQAKHLLEEAMKYGTAN